MDWPERWLCSWEALDLDAVRELASNAATAQASADAVAEDFYDTCVRRNIYLTVSSEMRAKFPIESLTKKPASEQAVAGTSASPATTYECSNERAASKSWRAANDVLFGYYVALGKLAGGARSNDSFGVKALATDLSGSSVMSSGQASAIGGLANDVLDEIYDAKRRGALAGYIAQADASVAAATKTLTGIATDLGMAGGVSWYAASSSSGKLPRVRRAGGRADCMWAALRASMTFRISCRISRAVWKRSLGLVDDMAKQRRDRGLGGEGELAGEHLVEDDADRVEVAPRVEPLSAPLLGRHVVRGSDDHAVGRQLLARKRAAHAFPGIRGHQRALSLNPAPNLYFLTHS